MRHARQRAGRVLTVNLPYAANDHTRRLVALRIIANERIFSYLEFGSIEVKIAWDIIYRITAIFSERGVK